ncbi:MAG: response regulator [Methanobacteriota archaeon]|nr:MAG: response regulator [Euryarchaeota archaeon]
MALIMVVDDEPDILYLVSKMLRKEGHEVIEALNGKQALEKLKERRPDLILLDVMMPGLNGWEVSKKIKSDPEYRSIPVAMLTVKSSEEDMEKSFMYANCDAHIAKPIIREKMLNTVRWLLQNLPKSEGGE